MKTPALEFTLNPATGKYDFDFAAYMLLKQQVEHAKAQQEAEYVADPQKRVVNAIKAAMFVPRIIIRAGGIEGTGTSMEDALADFGQKTGGRFTLHFGQNNDYQFNG